MTARVTIACVRIDATLRDDPGWSEIATRESESIRQAQPLAALAWSGSIRRGAEFTEWDLRLEIVSPEDE